MLYKILKKIVAIVEKDNIHLSNLFLHLNLNL